MRKFVIGGSVVVGAGLAVGLSVVGWMYLHRPEEPSARYSGGPMVLDTNTSPTPAPEGSLQVAGPDSVAANGGNAGTLLGSNGGKQQDSSANKLPGPSDFHQYEEHHDKPTALYIDVVVGQGKTVAVGSKTSVMYRGWLTDGTLFDESYSRKTVFTFTEGEHKVIPGWEQGLFGMKQGGKRRLIIPASQAYGAEGHAPIPSNAMLIFDIELIQVD